MFSNGNWRKNVKTVAEAIKELSLLPPDMVIDQDFKSGNGVDIVVFNRDSPKDIHVGFDEGGFWDEDADITENH